MAVNSFVFDEQFYLTQNPDVAAAVSAGGFASGQAHFNAFGRFEGRDPNAYFDTSFYLGLYPDVAAAGVNPFTHFQANGAAEGRLYNANIDGVVDTDGDDVADEFDSAAYLAANADVAAAIPGQFASAYQHYVLFGQFEGRSGAQLTDGTALNGPFQTGASGGGNVGQTFTLTAAAAGDVFVGGSKDDVFNSSATTLQNADILEGGAGTDTLSATFANGVAAGTEITPVLTNIENVNVNALSVGGRLDLTNSTGVDKVSAAGAGAFVLDNANLATTNDFVLDGFTNTFSLLPTSFAGTAAAGTAETVNLSVSGATFGSTAAAQTAFTLDGTNGSGVLETLNIASNGNAANELALNAVSGAVLGATNITGSADATVRVATAAISGTTVDATANTGKVTLDIDRNGATTASTNLTNVTGVDALAFRDSTAAGDALVATNVQSGVEVSVLSSFAAGGSLSVFGAATNTADILGLTLDNATANTGVTIGGLDVQNVETLNVESNGNAAATAAATNGNSATLTGDFSAVNLSGDTYATLSYTRDAVASGTSDTVIDASGLTGTAGANLTGIAGGGAATETFTITGSSNADIIVGGAEGNTISAGAGNDVITGGALNDTINGGDGNDTINLTAGSDTLSGNAGNDIFNVSDAVAGSTLAADLSIVTDFSAGAGAGDVMQFQTSLGLGAGGYYEGSAAAMTAATDYAFVVLTDQAYANVGAAEDAVAGQSTSATDSIVVFLNSSTGFAEAFYDADINNDDGLSDAFAQFQNVTTLTGVANFDASDFTIV